MNSLLKAPSKPKNQYKPLRQTSFSDEISRKSFYSNEPNTGVLFDIAFLETLPLFGGKRAHGVYLGIYLIYIIVLMAILPEHYYTLTEDACDSNTHSVSLRYLLFSVAFISLCFHLLHIGYNTINRITDEKTFNAIRWIDFGITFPIIMVIIAITVHVETLFSLILIFTNCLCAMMFQYLQDRRLGDLNVGRLPHVFSWVPLIISWALIMTGYVNSKVLDSKPDPTFSHFLLIFGPIFMGTVVLNQALFVLSLNESNVPKPKENTKSESLTNESKGRNKLDISLEYFQAYEGAAYFAASIFKITLLIIVLAGVKKYNK